MVEKLVLKKHQKGTGKNSDSDGKGLSNKHVKIVSVGECPECHKEFVRPYECTHATCNCKSATLIPLEPAIVVSKRRYVYLENFAKQAGVSVDRLVEVFLDTYIEELHEKGLLNLVKDVKQ